MAGNEDNRDCTVGALEQRAAVNLECGSPAAVFALENGFRDFESSTWSDWVDQKPEGGQEI